MPQLTLYGRGSLLGDNAAGEDNEEEEADAVDDDKGGE